MLCGSASAAVQVGRLRRDATASAEWRRRHEHALEQAQQAQQRAQEDWDARFAERVLPALVSAVREQVIAELGGRDRELAVRDRVPRRSDDAATAVHTPAERVVARYRSSEACSSRRMVGRTTARSTHGSARNGQAGLARPGPSGAVVRSARDVGGTTDPEIVSPGAPIARGSHEDDAIALRQLTANLRARLEQQRRNECEGADVEASPVARGPAPELGAEHDRSCCRSTAG